MTDVTVDKPVAFLDLTRQYEPLKKEIDEAIQSVIAQTSFVLGRQVEEFEEAFASYCGAKHCISVHSGTAALHIALLAMGVGPGDEVVTAPNSFIATAEAISFSGAQPRFVDAELDTANIDVDKIASAITEKTRAIIPVHLYGQPARMSKIMELAKAHNLKVLEDACQAHGARYRGARAGTIGDAGCFSFYPGKNLGAAGDGGAVVTNDAELAEKMRLLRNHGSERKYHHDIIGHNFRLDSIQCAILTVKLKHLDEWNLKRRAVAAFYDKRLLDAPGVYPIKVIDDCEPVYHLYVVRTDDSLKLQNTLKEMKVAHGIHYPIPIHLQPAYEYLRLKEGSFPNSELLSKSIVSLPIYPELTGDEQERVVTAVLKAAGVK